MVLSIAWLLLGSGPSFRGSWYVVKPAALPHTLSADRIDINRRDAVTKSLICHTRALN
jgi:hypothetical protein